MKKLLFFATLFSFFTIAVLAQSTYPFDVKISGTGSQSIILIPGLTCPGSVWNETVNHFDKRYTCYVLSFHGFGGVKPDSVANFKQWEGSVAAYIKNNHINKPVIIGHSIGGGTAMMLASDYPGLISKIIVIDALPCLAAISNPSFVAQQNPDCSPIVNQIMSISDSQFKVMQSMMIPLRELADTVHFQQVLNWSLTSDRRTIAEIFCQFTNTDLRESIVKIHCPALILLEPAFKNMQPVIQSQFKNLKTADIRYADKGLHFIMYDDPDWYFKQLDSFL